MKKKDKHPHFVFFSLLQLFARNEWWSIDRCGGREGGKGIHDDDNYQLQELRWAREEKK